MKRAFRNGITHLEGFGLRALTADQLDSIHYATLEVLEVTGLKVESEEAALAFSGAGAQVERSNGHARVKIPSYMVEECLRWAPRKRVHHGRLPAHDFVAEPNRVGYSTFGECIQVIDPQTREVRKSRNEDLALFCRLCDHYDELDVIVRPLGSTEKPPDTQALHNLNAILRNTGKHVLIGAHSSRNVSRMMELAALSVGGREQFKKRPHLTIFVCPTSPLTLGKDCCEIALETARLGMGLAIVPMALSGATSAATLAATLINHNAEVLSLLVLAQLARKGTPCTYCSMSTIMDLKSMVGSVGAPEHGVLGAGAVKLAQYYSLPSLVGGGISDSKIPDAQAGYEYAMNALLATLAGANIIYGAGALEMGLTIDHAKLVMDVGMIRFFKKILEGISTSDEAMALDLIHDVGPSGEFISSEHTYRLMRSQSRGGIFDRHNRSAWVERGRQDMTERAYEEAGQVLERHEPAPLPAGAGDRMDALVEDFERELGLRGR